MSEPKLLRVPDRVHSIEDLLSIVLKLENVEDVVVLINDAEGVWSMSVDGTSNERINWMLDRVKALLHE